MKEGRHWGWERCPKSECIREASGEKQLSEREEQKNREQSGG